MDVVWSWLIILPLLGIFVALIAAQAWVDDAYYYSERRRFWPPFCITLVTLIIVGNLFSVFMMKMDDTSTQWAQINTCQATGLFGLKSDTTYPTQVGARVSGTTGDGYFWSGLFSGSGKITMQPGSALSLGFDYQDKSAILEVPMSKITFVKDPKAGTPTVMMRLDCDAKQYYQSVTTHYGPSRLVLNSLVLMNYRDKIGTETDTSQIMADGLAPVVNASLRSVEIRLTPELYNKILG